MPKNQRFDFRESENITHIPESENITHIPETQHGPRDLHWSDAERDSELGYLVKAEPCPFG
jgi:hypothetical protein